MKGYRRIATGRGTHKVGKIEFRIKQIANDAVIVTLYSPYSDCCVFLKVEICDIDAQNAEENLTVDDISLLGKAAKWNSNSEEIFTIAYHAASAWSEKKCLRFS